MICFHFFFSFFFSFQFFQFIFLFISVFFFWLLSNKNDENTFCCVGVRHQSSTLSNEGERTETCRELLFGKWVQSNRRQSMTVSGNSVALEVLGNFHKSLGRLSAWAGRKVAVIVLQNLGRALKIGWKTGSVRECKDLEAALPTIGDVIRVYHNMKVIWSRKRCWNINIYTILQIRKCLLPSYIHLLDWNQLQLSIRVKKRKKMTSMVSMTLFFISRKLLFTSNMKIINQKRTQRSVEFFATNPTWVTLSNTEFWIFFILISSGVATAII